jgi:hypothetical protein
VPWVKRAAPFGALLCVCVCALACEVSTREAVRDADAGASAAPVPHVSAILRRTLPSRVERENARPGTSGWSLNRPALNHEVEGYASLDSAAPGQHVQLRINVDRPKSVHWELYRMGYYQGLGGRFISSSRSRMIEVQPACDVQSSTGLVECNWVDAFDVGVDKNWVSGQYFFKLIAEDGSESYVPLIVREAQPRAKVLFQSSTATWQAYNQFGGSSLYHNDLPAELGFKGDHADVVSFERPYRCNVPEARCEPGSGDFDLGERWLGRWLEQQGVDVAYVTSLDIDADPSLVQGRKLVLSVGHDEYWTVGVRDSFEAARAAGVSLGILSANTGYWRIRIDASTQGTPRRSIVCYKDGARDPNQNAGDTTVMFRSDPLPRPESALFGVMYDTRASRTFIDGFAQVVRTPEHWIYAGTGVRAGDVLAHVIGYEWDHVHDDDVSPKGLEILAHAQLINVAGAALSADLTLYYPTPSSFVFAAGSIYWSRGLTQPGNVDARIQRMMQNLLMRAGAAKFAQPIVVAANPPAPSSVTTLAGSGEAGDADGPGASAQFCT